MEKNPVIAQILTAVGFNLIRPHQSGLSGVLGARVLAKAKGRERETALWVAWPPLQVSTVW